MSIESSEEARKLLAEEYEKSGADGSYPTYAKLALEGNGAFTLCSLRAIQRALDEAKKTPR